MNHRIRYQFQAVSVLLFVVAPVNLPVSLAQSTTRGSVPRYSASQRRSSQARRHVEKQYQAEAERQSRDELLIQLTTRAGGRLNRKLSKLAFNEARQQYVDLKSRRLSQEAAARPLQQLFRLGPRELNRDTGQLRWPTVLKSAPFAEEMTAFQTHYESRASNSDASALLHSLSTMARQLAAQVDASRISAQDNALAKRFLTGLRYEFTHAT